MEGIILVIMSELLRQTAKKLKWDPRLRKIGRMIVHKDKSNYDVDYIYLKAPDGWYLRITDGGNWEYYYRDTGDCFYGDFSYIKKWLNTHFRHLTLWEHFAMFLNK